MQLIVKQEMFFEMRIILKTSFISWNLYNKAAELFGSKNETNTKHQVILCEYSELLLHSYLDTCI